MNSGRAFRVTGWRAVMFGAAALFCLTSVATAQAPSAESSPTVSPSPAMPAVPTPAPSAPAAETVRPATAETAPVASPTPVTDTAAPRAIGGHTKPTGELSAWSMFMDADILVKAVMLGLAFASVLTWTVFLAKSAELLLSGRRLKRSIREVEECSSLGEAQVRFGRARHVTAVLVQQAAQEARLSADIPGDAGLRERVASRFSDVQKTEGRIIRRGMGILATIGSTSPFVGLFGTVWGIMNSFIGIAKSQTTNLAVVAPGIAEALLATAIGLVAAIPAVIVYNHFARLTKGHMEAVSRAAGVVGRLLSRDLDRARGRPLSHAAE